MVCLVSKFKRGQARCQNFYCWNDLYCFSFVFSASGAKCEKANHWNIPVVSIKWLTDIILGDLSVMKLPINSCYTNITGDEPFTVDFNKVYHLLGMFVICFPAASVLKVSSLWSWSCRVEFRPIS